MRLTDLVTFRHPVASTSCRSVSARARQWPSATGAAEYVLAGGRTCVLPDALLSPVLRHHAEQRHGTEIDRTCAPLAAYLVVHQHVPVARAAQLIADVTGARPSTGWITSVLAPTAASVAPADTAILDLLRAAQVLHVDETSSNITGIRWWLHVAATPLLRGTLVHDSPALYDAHHHARHALCGAHLVRELTAAAEADPDEVWPAQAIRTLHQPNTAAHQARDQRLRHIPPEITDPRHRSFRHAVIVGLAEHPHRPGPRQSAARNLMQRLAARAEQVSGCHRSADTAEPGRPSAATSPPPANTAATSSPRSPETLGHHR